MLYINLRGPKKLGFVRTIRTPPSPRGHMRGFSSAKGHHQLFLLVRYVRLHCGSRQQSYPLDSTNFRTQFPTLFFYLFIVVRGSIGLTVLKPGKSSHQFGGTSARSGDSLPCLLGGAVLRAHEPRWLQELSLRAGRDQHHG